MKLQRVKSLSPLIFIIFYTLLFLILLSGCAVNKKIYRGSQLPPDQVAFIKCSGKLTEIDGINPIWFFTKSFNLEVLPGTHNLKFVESIIDGQMKITTIYRCTVSVKAGHTYKAWPDRRGDVYSRMTNSKCVIKDVTGEEKF